MKRRIKVVESNITNRINGVASIDTIREIYRAYNINSMGIPVDRLDRAKGVNEHEGELYKIRPMDDLEERIYVRQFDGDIKVIDTSWAVFKRQNGFWQQCTKWFMRYGDAERHMKQLAGLSSKSSKNGN